MKKLIAPNQSYIYWIIKYRTIEYHSRKKFKILRLGIWGNDFNEDELPFYQAN